MIYQESMLIGFQVINGNWEMQLGFFVGSLYQTVVHTDIIYDKDNVGFSQGVEYGSLYLTLVHLFLTFVTLLSHSNKLFIPSLKVYTNFCGVMINIYVLLVIARDADFLPLIKESPNMDTASLSNWFQIDQFYNLFIILASIIFLAIRAIFPHKFNIGSSVPEARKFPEVDFFLTY